MFLSLPFLQACLVVLFSWCCASGVFFTSFLLGCSLHHKMEKKYPSIFQERCNTCTVSHSCCSCVLSSWSKMFEIMTDWWLPFESSLPPHALVVGWRTNLKYCTNCRFCQLLKRKSQFPKPVCGIESSFPAVKHTFCPVTHLWSITVTIGDRKHNESPYTHGQNCCYPAVN